MPTVTWNGREIEWIATHVVRGIRTMKVVLKDGYNLPAFIDETGEPIHGGKARRHVVLNPSIPWVAPIKAGEHSREITPAQLALVLAAYVNQMAAAPNGEVAVRDGTDSRIVKLAINLPTGGQRHIKVAIPETFQVQVIPPDLQKDLDRAA